MFGMDFSWVCMDCVLTGVIWYVGMQILPYNLTQTQFGGAFVVVLAAMGAKMVNQP